MSKAQVLQTRTPLWIKFAFVAYVAVMLWLLFGQRLHYYASISSYIDGLKSHPLPLQTIVPFVSDLLDPSVSAYRKHNAATNLIGNIVMFIPLGYFLPCLFTSCRRFSRMIATDALIILGVETIQLITLLGSFDTDDFLFNVAGGMAGFGLYCVILRHFGRFLGLTSHTS